MDYLKRLFSWNGEAGRKEMLGFTVFSCLMPAGISSCCIISNFISGSSSSSPFVPTSDTTARPSSSPANPAFSGVFAATLASCRTAWNLRFAPPSNAHFVK